MKRPRKVDGCISFIQSILFPPACLLCDAPGDGGDDLCAGCRAELPWNRAACERCAAPLPQPGLCGACLKHPPPFDAAFAPLLYRAPVDWLLQRFKFNGRLPPGRLCGGLLAAALLPRATPLPQLIIPVPLHPSRLRRRGFNQALELARPVAAGLGVALAPQLCRRLRATETQSLLAARERRRNVRGAFELTAPLEVRHVAILDDVIATGSTVGELARVLRRAGAERIEVWAVARAG